MRAAKVEAAAVQNTHTHDGVAIFVRTLRRLPFVFQSFAQPNPNPNPNCNIANPYLNIISIHTSKVRSSPKIQFKKFSWTSQIPSHVNTVCLHNKGPHKNRKTSTNTRILYGLRCWRRHKAPPAGHSPLASVCALDSLPMPLKCPSPKDGVAAPVCTQQTESRQKNSGHFKDQSSKTLLLLSLNVLI